MKNTSKVTITASFFLSGLVSTMLYDYGIASAKLAVGVFALMYLFILLSFKIFRDIESQEKKEKEKQEIIADLKEFVAERQTYNVRICLLRLQKHYNCESVPVAVFCKDEAHFWEENCFTVEKHYSKKKNKVAMFLSL
tara:strand:- start:502 stop:915 length:414 start_codon:yes stop_codon:yes gene_type:complete